MERLCHWCVIQNLYLREKRGTSRSPNILRIFFFRGIDTNSHSRNSSHQNNHISHVIIATQKIQSSYFHIRCGHFAYFNYRFYVFYSFFAAGAKKKKTSSMNMIYKENGWTVECGICSWKYGKTFLGIWKWIYNMTLCFCVWLRKHEKCGYFGGFSFNHGYLCQSNFSNIFCFPC